MELNDIKDWQKALVRCGYQYTDDWGTPVNTSYTRKQKYILRVEPVEEGLKFSMCPFKLFDRWANSRHISWIMLDDLPKKALRLTEYLKDAEYLCRKIPKRFFNKFIHIELM